MGFENLTGMELDKTFQGLTGLMKGQDPASVEVPNLLTNVKQNLVARMVANVFDKDQGFAPAELSADPSTAQSPRAKLLDIARRAINKEPLTSLEIEYFHTLLNLNGADNIFNGDISEEELVAAQRIVDGYAAGKSTLDNRDAAQAIRDAAAALAEQEMRAAQAAEQIQLTESFGFSALGYDGTRSENITDLVRSYQEPLQRDSEQIFGRHMNSFEIIQAMEDSETGAAFSTTVLSYIVKSGDFRDVVVEKLEAGQIEEAQALLNLSGQNIDVNGAFTEATQVATHAYMDADLGLGDTNFRFAANENPDALYDNQISTSAITANINSGGVPLLPETLAPMLAVDGMTIEDLQAMPIDMQSMIVATYLSDEHNFQAYDAALKERGMEGLDARLDNLTLVEAPVYIPQTGATAVIDAAVPNLPADLNTGNLQVVALEAAINSEILVSDSHALGAKLETDAEIFHSIESRISSDMLVDDGTPPEIVHLVGLLGSIDAAEAALTSYEINPTFINSGNNNFGPNGVPIVVEGMVGAPYSPIKDVLENNIIGIQNDYLTYLTELTSPQKQGMISYLDAKDAPTLDGVIPANVRDMGGPSPL